MDGCDFIPIETEQPTGPLYRIICEVRPDDTDDGLTDVDRANARLIATAPELLEALEAFNLGSESIVSGSAETITLRVPIKAIQDAARAIAKATGAA
jgi:hypothetical protein